MGILDSHDAKTVTLQRTAVKKTRSLKPDFSGRRAGR
jgi:hypothetical protein